MENEELLKRLLDKAIEMYFIAKKDRLLYGNSYVEITERGMRIIDSKDLMIKVDVAEEVYGESPINSKKNSVQKIKPVKIKIKDPKELKAIKKALKKEDNPPKTDLSAENSGTERDLNRPKRKRRTKAEMISDGEQTKEPGVRKKKTNRLFSEEIDDFIKKNWEDNRDIDLIEMIEEKFGIKYKKDQIKTNRRQLGCVANRQGPKVKKKIGPPRKYPSEMKEYIIEHMDQNNQDLCKLINQKFGIKITCPKLAAFMAYNRIKRQMGPGRKYSKEAIEFLKENANNFSNRELAEELDHRFHIKTDQQKLAATLHNKGIKRDIKLDTSPEIIEFIKKQKTTDAFALRDKVIEEFEVNFDVPTIRKYMTLQDSGESVEAEVKRIQEKREEPEELKDDEDIDDLGLDD